MTAALRIVPLAPHHRPRWEFLYAGYAEFYRVTQTPEMRARVWGWTQDPAHEVKGLIAEDAHGQPLAWRITGPLRGPYRQARAASWMIFSLILLRAASAWLMR